MESNRKVVVQVYIFLLILIIPMIGMFLFLGLPKKQFLFGSLIGVALALISFSYLMFVWASGDVIIKKPKSKNYQYGLDEFSCFGRPDCWTVVFVNNK